MLRYSRLTFSQKWRIVLILVGPIVLSFGLNSLWFGVLYLITRNQLLALSYSIELMPILVLIPLELSFLYLVARWFNEEENRSVRDLILGGGVALRDVVVGFVVFLAYLALQAVYVFSGIAATAPRMSLLGGVIWAVGAITIAPVAEEVMWRGYALGRLYKVYNYHWRAILITALSWAFFHGPNIYLIIITFAAGIVAGYTYLRSQRLIQVIIAHLLINVWNWSTYLLVLA